MRRRFFLKKFLACMVLFFWTPFLCGLLFWKMEVKKTPKWEQNTETGSSLPSRNSSEAPPPVEMWLIFEP